ncbi:MAG: hypothetical protein ABJM82_18045 [Shimia thalassica]|uniref:hypothetical protein n=1 Tax=Rhodobacterales TaxID=204455 RepID=UPI003298D833
MLDNQWQPLNFATVNLACMHRLPALLAAWLPDGVQQGREWVALNPTRHDRRKGSFRINLEKGCWADFATDDKGGDPVSLYAYLNRMSQSQAARTLLRDWGLGR